MERARVVLVALAEMLRTLLSNLDLKRTTLLVTGDHGNLEDLSSKNHTLNKVPTLIWGAQAETLARRISSLADITPAILETLEASRSL
jgi:bisphosphoglycerate-independent phosphoglycerate mutase (AlkP superfamily)